MDLLRALGTTVVAHWPIWVVTVVLIVAAVIDGFELRVPNWVTLPMILGGWVFSWFAFGWSGLAWSFVGTSMGLALLMPAYAIGGMGAGDVKLLAGVGAWVHATHTFYAFAVSAVVGGILAIAMVLARRSWKKHADQFAGILAEMNQIRDPERLSALAAERKSSMMLLPYGIPIAIGSILYFAWTGLLI